MADIQQLIEADKALLLSLNGSDSLFWDGFMWTVTDTRTWIPALVVLLYVHFQEQPYTARACHCIDVCPFRDTGRPDCVGYLQALFCPFPPCTGSGADVHGTDGQRLSWRFVRIYFQPCGQHLCGGHVCFIAGTLFTVHVHDVSLGVDTFVFTHLSGSALSR